MVSRGTRITLVEPEDGGGYGNGNGNGRTAHLDLAARRERDPFEALSLAQIKAVRDRALECREHETFEMFGAVFVYPAALLRANARLLMTTKAPPAARRYRLVLRDGADAELGTLRVTLHTLGDLVVFRTRKPLTRSEVETITTTLAKTGRTAVVVDGLVEVVDLIPEGGTECR